MSAAPSPSAPAQPSSLQGCLWVAWCAAMFFVVFVGGGRVIDVFVTAPYCASLCASDGGFDHFRVGGRSGPSNACICKSERAVDTSLPDAATAVCVLAFLIACYAPLPLLARANDAKKSQP